MLGKILGKRLPEAPVSPAVVPAPLPAVVEPALPLASEHPLESADIASCCTLVTVLVDAAQPSTDKCDVITDVHLCQGTLETEIGNITLAVHGGVVMYRLTGGECVMGSIAEAALKKTNAPINHSVAVTEKQTTEQSAQRNTEITGKVLMEASLTGVKGTGETAGALKNGMNDKNGGERSLTYTETQTYFPVFATPVAGGVTLTINPVAGPNGIEKSNVGNAWPTERLFSVKRTGDGPVRVETEFKADRRFIEICDGTGEFEQIETQEQRNLIRLLLAKLAESEAWNCGETQLLSSRETTP